ncbi:Nap1p-binding protein [Fusarium denticulatum]|uniref:Nap1p-binding protein n=1 Tax=Fusarium denticulatum TaxID=48507 RepID=A0A8H6CV94_9HYPO|nr:Nap1p-binding protein [Fusarium denticulatum]
MSTTSSPVTSPSAAASSSPNPNHPALPPLITSPPSRRSMQSRPMSHVSRSRLSQYSTGSLPTRSRPTSHMFPMFPSTLSYTQVRDFAYPATHPLHYGPPPEPSGPPSGMTTPASEHRRLSDPPVSWETRMPWESWGADGFNRGHDLAPIQFDGGPPYSEDEDLQSPVVATRHRKHKSTSAATTLRGRTGRDLDMHSTNYDHERGYYMGTSGDGSETYYVNNGGEANGPGGDFVTYPPEQARHSRAYHIAQQPRAAEGGEYYQPESDSSPSSPGYNDEDQSRYSRDYQFTITSPDEEFHGKAVALFDFERENENELPLVEGQIIWVSYRHGQGWLVAEDPKTQESGLVPEEYVRLLRDIEGGMNSLAGHLVEGTGSPDVGTPTQAEHSGQYGHTPSSSNATNGYHQPIVSMFSTSSKDLDPYPTEQLGLHSGQPPPQVIHYHGQRGGSQANTPTIAQPQDTGILRRESHDGGTKRDSNVTPVQTKPPMELAEPGGSEEARGEER